MEPIFIRSAYNYDMDAASKESGLLCLDKTRTQQHFKDEADINVIVERFGLTGEIPAGARLPLQGDFTGIFDYQSAMNTLVAAKDAFMQLSAKVRARFHNDPQEIFEFLQDPENRPEAEKLGLVNKKVQEPVVEKLTSDEKPKPGVTPDPKSDPK